jgi:hypothetical protein
MWITVVSTLFALYKAGNQYIKTDVHKRFEPMTERKQRRSFQGWKNAVTSIMTEDSSCNHRTAKTV